MRVNVIIGTAEITDKYHYDRLHHFRKKYTLKQGWESYVTIANMYYQQPLRL